MLVGYVIVGVRGQDSYQSPFRDGVRSLASYVFRRGCGLRARHLSLTRASGRTFSVQWFQLIPTGHDDNSIAYVTKNVKFFWLKPPSLKTWDSLASSLTTSKRLGNATVLALLMPCRTVFEN